MVEHAAYVFGLLTVLVFIVAAFVLAGVIQPADVAGGKGPAGEILAVTGSAFAAVALIVLIMLAAVDGTIGKRFVQRFR